MHLTMNNMCRRHFHKPAHAVLIAAGVLVLVAASLVRVHASDGLELLNEAQQDAVMRLCSPSQFLEGPQAFRDCLLQRVAEVQNNTDVQFSALSGLALDEQHVIQRFCSSSQSSLSSPTYLACAGTQLLQLEDEPQPNLADIAQHEQYAITQQCFASASLAGAREYRACVNNAIETLETLPPAIFTDQSITARNTIQLECTQNTNSAGDYRRCLLDTLGIEFTPERDTSAQEPDEIDGPATAEASETQRQSGEDTSEPIAPEIADTAPLNDLTEPATASNEEIAPPDTVRPAFWIALLVALAIPLIILGLWLRRRSARGGSRSQPATSTTSGVVRETLTEQSSPIRPNLKPFTNDTVDHSDKTVDLKKLVRQTQENVRSPDLSTQDLDTQDLSTQDLDTQDLSTQDLGTQDLSATETNTQDLSTPDFATSDPAAPFLDRAESTQNGPDSHEQIEKTIPIQQPRVLPKDRGRFSTWLGTLPADYQQENAIGLLLYWIAYADDRYDPALKKRIFQLHDPDDKDLIKRWAFKKDAVAFSDAIRHLQSHTYTQQREQIVNLLMALLVDEMALTPVQNILLRFVADSFGILKTSLSRMYHQAYGDVMPAIPRPDKVIWWEKIDAEQKLRWDARALLSQSDQVRYRVLLGQPLYDKLDLSSVVESYRRAIRRCELEQASELGDWERSLLDLKRARFEAARKHLMDIAT